MCITLHLIQYTICITCYFIVFVNHLFFYSSAVESYINTYVLSISSSYLLLCSWLSFYLFFRYAKGEDKHNWITIDQLTAEIRLNKLPDRESLHLVNGTYYAKIICITTGRDSFFLLPCLEITVH